MLILLRKAIDGLVDLSAILGGLALVFVTGVILTDVVGRAMGSPLYGVQDLVEMSALFVVFGGMAYVDRRGGHVTVDLLEHFYSPRLNKIFVVLGCLTGAVIFGLIAWQTWEASKLSVMLNRATNILFLPRAPFQYGVVVLSAITSLAMFARGLRAALDTSAASESPYT